jgi:hypothetical protein
MLLIRAVGSVLLLAAAATDAVVAQTRPLSISGLPTPDELRSVLGNGWFIYLDGEIDADAGKRLSAFLAENKVPGTTSLIVLNSLGGSLVGGIELGRVIRKHGLSTDVGIRKENGGGARGYTSGVCFSACATAYLGGRFRFLNEGSRYGVHRFYFSSSTGQDADVAQLLSAMVVSYLREMDIDTELFSLTTMGGRDEMLEPPRSTLEALRVVNNGFTEPKWSIESTTEFLYLKGERDTIYGINKFMMHCNGAFGVLLHVIFDPQGREDEVMRLRAHSLVINSSDVPISPVATDIQNGWFNAHYKLSPKHVRAMSTAKHVGLIVRGSFNAPIFVGFNRMPFQGAAQKLQGILKGCGYAGMTNWRSAP